MNTSHLPLNIRIIIAIIHLPIFCLAQDSVPKVIIEKPVFATNEPSQFSKKIVYLLVNDTVQLLATYDRHYYIKKGDKCGFISYLYGDFYGDSSKLIYMEVNKASVFISEDRLNISELKKIEKGKIVLFYKTGKPGPPVSTRSSPSKNSVNTPSSHSIYRSSYSSTCGASTKKGGACQRVVQGGGRCWQHGG